MIDQTLGNNTSSLFEADIRLYIAVAANVKESKMSGALMRSALLEKYPRRYDVPMEQQINGSTQNLFGGPTHAQPQVPSIVCMTESRNVDLEGLSSKAPEPQAVSHRRMTISSEHFSLLTDAVHVDASFMLNVEL